jgi:hypothetical protein
MLYGCVSLEKVEIDVTNATAFNSFFTMTDNLKDVYIKGLCFSLSLYSAYSLTKDSLLYIINNANPPEGGITITLQNNAYTRLAEDADIVAALEGKNITLGK